MLVGGPPPSWGVIVVSPSHVVVNRFVRSCHSGSDIVQNIVNAVMVQPAEYGLFRAEYSLGIVSDATVYDSDEFTIGL